MRGLPGACVLLGAAMAFAAAGPGLAENRLLAMVNGERSARGLTELRWNQRLADLARAHALDMRATGRLSHQSRDGTSFFERLQRIDLAVSRAAENVARDRDIQGAHAGLMASPGHRKNILDPELTDIGIGIGRAGSGLWVVQDFASPLPRLSVAEAAILVRSAISRAAKRSGSPGVTEDRPLSLRLEVALEEMIGADKVDARKMAVAAPVWLFAWTATDPEDLPSRVRRRAVAARTYGLAIDFRRTDSAPFGLYWIAVALRPALP